MNHELGKDRSTGSEADHEVIFQRESTIDVPKVTVAVSLYNYERYIIECLESVRNQTAELMDLIVTDDCSQDGSAEATRRWMNTHWSRFRRCQLLRHSVNQGLSAARNLSFRHARTEYVFVLDADNTIYPRSVDALSAALDQCDASFAYSHVEKFGAERGLLTWRPWDAEALQFGNFIDAMAMIRKGAWERVDGYSTDMKSGLEDYDFWLKIAACGGWGILVPEVLTRYRVHLSSMIRTQTNLKVTLIWDYLERKHRGVRRPPGLSDGCLRDNDEVIATCERIRFVREPVGKEFLDIRGWALARSGIARVDLLIDGRPLAQARYGDLRPDLGERAEGYPNGIRCGFSSRVDLPEKTLDDDDHILTFCATATTGKVAEIHETIRVAARSVDGTPGPKNHRVGDHVVV